MAPKKRKLQPRPSTSKASPAVKSAEKVKAKYKKAKSPDRKSRVRRALYDVTVNKVSVRKAAKKYNFPYSFIQRRVSGSVEIDARNGPTSVFSAEEERQFAIWLSEMAKRGMGLRPGEFLDKVQEIVLKGGRKTPFKEGRPSYDWYRSFMERNEDIVDIRKEVLLESSRAKLDKKGIDSWYSNYRNFLTEKDLIDKPERIWNADETGFNLLSKAGKVIGPSRGLFSTQVPHLAGTSSKARLTVMFCASASGSIMPPFYAFPKPAPRGVNPLSCSLPGGKVEYTEKGWMDGVTFTKFLEHFHANVVTERPVLLLIDSVGSHINLSIFQKAREKGIELYRIVPNATHLMQPLDKGVLGPLKTQWYKTLKKHNREHPGTPINKSNFAEKLRDAYNDFYRPSIVVNSFSSSGIYPFNRKVISDEQLKTALTFTTDTDDEQPDTEVEKRTSCPAEAESVEDRVFNTYVSVLKTPVREKYEKRQEEGYDIQGASPGYDTYVLLKSKVDSNVAHGLKLLAEVATRSTPDNYSLNVGDKSEIDKVSSEKVSPIITESLTRPRINQKLKPKRRSALDGLPDNLTSPESIRKFGIKDLQATRAVAEKEKKAEASYLSKIAKKVKQNSGKNSKKRGSKSITKVPKMDLKSRKSAVTAKNINETEEDAKCMACEMTWKEDETLMLGHTWIQCDMCQGWIHENCTPMGLSFEKI